MWQKIRVPVLAGLLVIAAAVTYWNFTGGHTAAVSGVPALGAKYTPLSIENPSLRMDLLKRIRNFEYTGRHRNIFSHTLPPAPPPATVQTSGPGGAGAGPEVPAGPPPLQIPVKFFGFATDRRTGVRRAFFTNGEDVFIVSDGEMLLGRFRVLHIGDNTVELEEPSTGRRATLQMEEPGPSA